MDPTARYKQVVKSIPFRHTPFPPGKNIRLLRLLPNKSETAIIKCQLFNYSLEPDSHQYDALSYVWGNPNETLPILIDKHVLHITANLHAALLCLRDHSLERIIWVDAVCIDQANEKEKKHQIQSMVRIYGQANRVIVWLGKAENDSNRALESIRNVAEDESANVSNSQKAVLALLRRPWFERIWVLQEVAAARHVLIMCGSAKIDGYAFCLGLELLKGLYETHEDLQGPIRSIIYLIRGAIFRPKYTTSRSGIDSLGICPLGELIDMYHTHKATELHDKVYALLGMSSVDGSIVSLSPNYGVPWEDLLQQLVKILLHEQVSVETGPKKEMALIRSKGLILGQVSSVKSYIARDSRQGVNIIFKITPERLQHNQKYAHWTLKVSAKQVRKGDIICLLQGAPKPVIVRPCKDHFAVIRIAAFPEDKRTESGDIEWSKCLQSITAFPRDLLLVWNWTEKLDLGEYENLIRTNEWMSEHSKTGLERRLDKATRMWNFALILEELGEYKVAEKRLQEAIESYEMALGEEHLHALKSQYSRTPLLCAAWNWYGVVVNARTSLWLAARGGHKVVTKLLLETGKVDIHSMIENGRTLLSWAAEGGHLAVVEQLLQEKAEVNAAAEGYGGGRTALQAAAGGGHLAVVERLLQEKAEVNAAAAVGDGRTALQAAAEGGHLAVVERLLQEKAEVNAAAAVGGGRTALQAAAGGGHLAVELLLRHAGAIK